MGRLDRRVVRWRDGKVEGRLAGGVVIDGGTVRWGVYIEG